MKEIPLFKVYMNEGLEKPLMDILNSGYIGQGKVVDQFEEKLKSVLNCKYVATVNSATSGLHLLLRILSSEETEVLTTPLTCTATNFAILANNLKLKWVDIDSTCNIDLDDLERKLSPTTHIIMLVHWGGNPIDLSRIEKIRNKCFELYGFKPFVIQDNAHAMLSEFESKQLSEYYNSVYSFQAIKHVTSVDGGCIVSGDELTHRQAVLMRWYGLDRNSSADFRCEQNIEHWGYKFHMNDVNACIGMHNLQKVYEIVDKHVSNSKYLDKELESVSGVRNVTKLRNAKSSQWVHTIHVENRDGFVRKLKEKGIASSQVHRRNDEHSCLLDYKVSLPGLEKYSKSMICIPNGWWVTPEDLYHIVNTIKEGW